MIGSEARGRDMAGIRLVLPCGHRLTVPWGLTPEVAALLHHQSVCEYDPGIPALAANCGSLPTAVPTIEVFP